MEHVVLRQAWGEGSADTPKCLHLHNGQAGRGQRWASRRKGTQIGRGLVNHDRSDEKVGRRGQEYVMDSRRGWDVRISVVLHTVVDMYQFPLTNGYCSFSLRENVCNKVSGKALDSFKLAPQHALERANFELGMLQLNPTSVTTVLTASCAMDQYIGHLH